jgi:uncharacterized protein YkwD
VGRRLLAGTLFALALTVALGDSQPVAPAASDGGPVASAAGKRQLAARVERRLFRCTNVRRRKNGLRPLRKATALKRAARFHAKNMARHGFFSHTDHRGRGPGDRVALFKPKERLHSIGENIAAGYPSAAAACRAWMGSGGHRANILGHYSRIGLGFWSGGTYGSYFVQVFARGG